MSFNHNAAGYRDNFGLGIALVAFQAVMLPYAGKVTFDLVKNLIGHAETRRQLRDQRLIEQATTALLSKLPEGLTIKTF